MGGSGDLSGKFEVETTLVRGGSMRSNFGETAEAIFMTSGFAYASAEQAEARFSGDDPGFVYSRYRNPTLSMFEERLRLLEGAGACHGAASGMAAVNAALLCCLSAGDHLVASRALFGSCFYLVTSLLPRLGIETSLVDGGDLAAWQAAMRTNTRAVFLETPANPTLAVIDLPGVAAIAHAHGARVIVDNVFATPLLQKPLQLGADIVVYSATKHIDGQGRCLGGAVLADAEWCEQQLQPFLRHTGPALSPFNAWLLLKGLETLSLRLERSCASALTIARHLENHPAVARVYYPHLASHPHYELACRQMSAGGSLIAFVMKKGQKAAFALMNALRIVDISNNLGDTKSLITHPMTTTHRAMPQEDRQAMGIGDGLVRLSVGLENAADLIADLDRAMAAAQGAGR